MTINDATNGYIGILEYGTFEEIIPPSTVYTMRASPHVIAGLTARGANTAIVTFDSIISKLYNSVQYTGGGTVQMLYAGGSKSAGATMTAANVNSAVNAISRASITLTSTNLISDVNNKNIVLTNLTAAFATGNSPIKVGGSFMVIDLTGLI